MPSGCNFTYAEYRDMLRSLRRNGYRFDYFPRPARLFRPKKTIYLRHDVDYDLDKALHMARINHEMRIRSTFLFMIHNPFYQLCSPIGEQVVREIRRLGHEVGLHVTNSLPRDPKKIGQIVTEQCDMLESVIGGKVQIVSFHSPSDIVLGASKHVHGNRISTYCKELFTDLKYVSDSGCRWQEGMPHVSPWVKQKRSAQILVHPVWWDEKPRSKEDKIDSLPDQVPSGVMQKFARKISRKAVDFLILIPTYRRPHLFDQLVREIHTQASEAVINYRIITVDDCSGPDMTQAYNETVRSLEAEGVKISFMRMSQNCGRKEQYKVFNRLLGTAKQYRFRYAIYMADDLMLCDNFFERVSTQIEWEQAQDHTVCAMNIFSTFPVNWGVPQYVDGAFVANRVFFETFGWSMNTVSVPCRRYGLKTRLFHDLTYIFQNKYSSIAPCPGVSFVTLRGNEPSVLYPQKIFPKRQPNRAWVDRNFLGRNGDDNGDRANKARRDNADLAS